ncbi:hypothetical protein GCM10022223_28580 [Kineosporia mesophila]|uniref:Uncharacterized protein n=1 Tax=Kineosporia mesophila TaxID=566012 RepID=A0ABP6ZMG1_9ACTN
MNPSHWLHWGPSPALIAAGQKSVTPRLTWILCQITAGLTKGEPEFTLSGDAVTRCMDADPDRMQDDETARQSVKEVPRNLRWAVSPRTRTGCSAGSGVYCSRPANPVCQAERA